MDLGRIAYEAYSAEVGGQNFMGEPMPAWLGLTSRQQEGWRQAATAAIRASADG